MQNDLMPYWKQGWDNIRSLIADRVRKCEFQEEAQARQKIIKEETPAFDFIWTSAMIQKDEIKDRYTFLILFVYVYIVEQVKKQEGERQRLNGVVCGVAVMGKIQIAEGTIFFMPQ